MNGSMESRQREVLVIGHKNPDTDSICSAIAYAALKQKLTGDTYIPCRAGDVSRETAWVLPLRTWPRRTMSSAASIVPLPRS